jgi:hypothetical protein
MTKEQFADRIVHTLLTEAFEEVDKIQIGHMLAVNGRSNMRKQTHSQIKDKVRIKLYELMGLVVP